jgi:hypothetical protein
LNKKPHTIFCLCNWGRRNNNKHLKCCFAFVPGFSFIFFNRHWSSVDSATDTKLVKAFAHVKKQIVCAYVPGISNNKDVVHLIKPFPVPVSERTAAAQKGAIQLIQKGTVHGQCTKNTLRVLSDCRYKRLYFLFT